MSSYKPGDSVNAAAKSAQASEMQSNADSNRKDADSGKKSAPTEAPREPDHKYHAFERVTADPLAVGNPTYELSLTMSGRMGFFIPKNKTNPNPIRIPIITREYYVGAFTTMKSVMLRQLRAKTTLDSADIESRATNIACRMTDGIMVMTYLKLRALNMLVPDQYERFLAVPKVPKNFEIPEPFALAVSQLGVVKISSMDEEHILAPTMPAGSHLNFGLPDSRTWSPTAYIHDVEYAKSVGIRFQSVNLQVKLGSSWWIYEVTTDHGMTLRCRYPEDNYTPASAVLYTLFCIKEDLTFGNVIFDFSGQTTGDYGSMLRNPHADIHTNTYYAVEASDEQLWNAV